MATDRILTDAEANRLGRKVESMEAIPVLELRWDRLAELYENGPVLGALVAHPKHLDEAVAAAGGATEFIVIDHQIGKAWVVNTEGYDYARYVAQLRGC